MGRVQKTKCPTPNEEVISKALPWFQDWQPLQLIHFAKSSNIVRNVIILGSSRVVLVYLHRSDNKKVEFTIARINPICLKSKLHVNVCVSVPFPTRQPQHTNNRCKTFHLNSCRPFWYNGVVKAPFSPTPF